MKEFKAESKKLLDLVVNSIYTNREIFLRELISNASDALDKRRFAALTDSALDAEFHIDITADEGARTLTISDNGIGMTEEELENNLGVIAASGTEAFKKERGETDAEQLIGQFGVGFYSAFMVADKVTVVSRKAGSSAAYEWKSNGTDGFDIEKSERGEAGTTVTLYIKQDGNEDYSQYLKVGTIKSLVKKYSDYIKYPIRMEVPKAPTENGDVSVSELTTLNSMTPVWKKSKSELDDKELDEFYKRTYHDYRDPLFTVSSRVEGAVAYTALLFVPSEPSYDYYTKDYKRGLQLYCNGVLVMDKCAELIPEYLGFIRGVVDTPDLALNISRETLQQDRRVRAIANGLEKKILSEFEKLLKNDREKYEKIFGAFSKALKFGAYDNFGANKDKLKDLLMYHSDAQNKLVTFKEYVEKQGDKAPVLYACGETVEKISMLPQLEGARGAGKDVLYFTEPVDEFIARLLSDYDGHKFENIASGDDKAAKVSDGHKQLIDKIADKLKGKASVCATDKLKSYPVCLAAKGDVSLEMERVMDAMGGGIKAERVLQVNLDHPVIAALEKADDGRFSDMVTVLYNEALIAEGYKTEPEFLTAVNRLLAGADAPKAEVAAKKSTEIKQTEKKTAAKKTAEKSTTVEKPKSGDKKPKASDAGDDEKK